MWISTSILVFALGATASPTFKSCGPQNIVLQQLSDTWNLPVTKMTPYSTCTYSFQIPSGTYAEVAISATGLGNMDTITAVGFRKSFKGTNESYQLTTLSPSKFDVTFNAGQDSTMSVQFTVALQQVSTEDVYYDNVRKDNMPAILYIDQWRVGKFYWLKADTVPRLLVALNGVNTDTQYLLNNIFVYDGDNTPFTLLDVQPSYYLGKNKMIKLYLAKPMKDLQGAVYLIDNSNLDGILNYNVQFVPTDPLVNTSYISLIAGWQNQPTPAFGAVTVLGKAGGKSPIDVRAINILKGNGTLYYGHGAPTATKPDPFDPVEPFGQKDLPLNGWGVANTFYLSQGEANLMYTIN